MIEVIVVLMCFTLEWGGRMGDGFPRSVALLFVFSSLLGVNRVSRGEGCVGTQRLESAYKADPEDGKFLYNIVRKEVAAGATLASSSNTNGLLWLTRQVKA